MLQPKRQKHRKQQKGRSRKRLVETRGLTLAFGDFGLQAQSAHWVNGRQIEAARKAINNFLKREGKLWIRIFPDKPITKMPPEVTMGGGKGDIDQYICPVKPGRVLFEVGGIDEASARQALRLAGFKMPLKTKVISRFEKKAN